MKRAFKAYDIRGLYGEDFDADDVYCIGTHLPALLNATRVLVGRDARVSSPEIEAALVRGLREGGADVDLMGLATTPMVYYFTAEGGYGASVQITASHNAAPYNGLKISRAGAVPVGLHSGLAELARHCEGGPRAPAAAAGTERSVARLADYLSFLRPYVPDLTGIPLAIDCSNGMAALVIRQLLGDAPHYLFEEIDGTYPNHAPNPLEEENCQALMDDVRAQHCALGVIFDGDADRVMFVDEKGRFIRPDLMIPLLARYYLAGDPGATVLHDIRTSRGVTEQIRELGGVPVMWKVGHAFAKVKLREVNGVVGGELAGHYYFRDFHWCDSGVLACLVILNVLAQELKAGRQVSACVSERYANTGERNYRIEAKQEAMSAVVAHFTATGTPDALFDFDGYRVEYADWWFNIRPSNTEPWLRLIVEAKDATMLSDRLNEIEAQLAPFRAPEEGS